MTKKNFLEPLKSVPRPSIFYYCYFSITSVSSAALKSFTLKFQESFLANARSHDKMINFAIYFQIKQFKMNETLALNISMVFFIHSVLLPMSRSSRQSCSIRKDVLKNFAKIHRRTPVPEPIF